MKIAVGRKIGAADLAVLPPTTRVAWNQRDTLVRRYTGRWSSPANPNANYTLEQLAGAGFTVLWMPIEGVEVPDSGEDFATWQARFVHAVSLAARQHGVGNSTLDPAFARIGVDKSVAPVPPVPGSTSEDRNLARECPVGSLIYGYDYDGGRRYLMARRDDHWETLAPQPGLPIRPGSPWTLLRWGADGPVSYIPEPVGEDERRRVAVAKARAWRVGMSLKNQHGWCGTLEQILASGGVTQADEDPGLVQAMDTDRQRALPVGSLLLWTRENNELEWELFIRDDTASNAARTRRLFGTSVTATVRNSRNRAVPVWQPGQDLSVDLPPTAFQALARILPDRWQFIINNECYRIVDDDTGRRLRLVPTARAGAWHTPATGRREERSYHLGDVTQRLVSATVTYIPAQEES